MVSRAQNAVETVVLFFIPGLVPIGIVAGVIVGSIYGNQAGLLAAGGTALLTVAVFWLMPDPKPSRKSAGPTPRSAYRGHADKRAYYKNQGLD